MFCVSVHTAEIVKFLAASAVAGEHMSHSLGALLRALVRPRAKASPADARDSNQYVCVVLEFQDRVQCPLGPDLVARERRVGG
jgi:hypothetical protein